VTGFVQDPLTGRPTVIVGSRQDRPNRPETGTCPFCPGGIEAPGPYDVRWFVNRWPAMPDDRCEIVLYTAEHDATFWSLGVDGARRVVDVWAERTAALGARPDVAYALVFENRGAEVGATIPHPHGQIYAFDHVPPAPREELLRATAGPCPLCVEPPDELVVATSGTWRAHVPAAAGWPYELLVAPADHLPDLPGTGADARHALAAVLVDVLGRLDRLFRAPMPYMLWMHQRPTDGAQWRGAHLHLHVAPFLRAPGTPRYVAAGELGSGVHFNPVPPERAAADLRRA
jgi:UDPglucose--hexose-1-phosphate uridylyltransferase